MTTLRHKRSVQTLVPRALRPGLLYGCLGVILLVASGLRFIKLGSAPGYEWDETVYDAVGQNVANGAGITLSDEVTNLPFPYLSHPPFYFQLLGLWYDVFGQGVTQARALAAVSSLIVLVLVFVLIRMLKGDRIALATTFFVAIDGWVVFTNRVSWIENTQLILIMLAMITLVSAEQQVSVKPGRYLAAGLLFGSAIAYKHIAVFLLLGLVLYCFTRKQREKYIWMTVAVAVGVVALYGAMMSLVYGSVYWDITIVQFLRSTGGIDSRGSLSSPTDFIAPLLGSYSLFVGTVALAIVGIVTIFLRIGIAYKTRSLAGLGNNVLLGSWVLAAFCFFCVSGVKMPHYFILMLLPLTCFVVAEIMEWAQWQQTKQKRMVAVAALVLVGLHGFAFYEREMKVHGNPLRDVAVFMEENVPSTAMVVADQTVGVAIPQRYCSLDNAVLCADQSDYVVTYVSFTEKLPENDPTFQALSRKLVPVKSFVGFRENITVWRVKR